MIFPRHNLFSQFPAALFAVAVMAACSPFSQTSSPPPEIISTAGPQSAPVKRPLSDVTPLASSTSAPEKKVTRKPDPLNTPSQLTGFSGDQMEALLGLPSFKRRDPPAEIWQYGGAACLLDIFLYEDHGVKTLTVAHSEARTREGQEMAYRECLTDLMKEQRRKNSG